MRTLNYSWLKNKINMPVFKKTTMTGTGIKKLRNLYACLGVACVLVTYTLYVYEFSFTYIEALPMILPMLPIFLFLFVSFGFIVSNYVYLLSLDIFDIIARYLICGGRAIDKENKK